MCGITYIQHDVHRCDDVAKKYYYSVEYGGVGDPPNESVNLGHCSQIAVFTRSQKQSEDVIETPYQLVCQVLI